MAILVNADFETGDPLQGVFSSSSLLVYPGYSAAIDDTRSRTGSKSVRIELRSTDPLKALGRRSELAMNSGNPLNPSIRWYAFSIFIPENYINDTLAEIIFQVADNTGMTAPNLAIWIRNSEYFINRKWDTGSGPQEVQTKVTGDAKVARGSWDDWRIYYLPSITGSGLIKVYRNGALVFEYGGANANAQAGVLVPSRYCKVGCYKWPWNNPGAYYPNSRVFWFDNIMYGDDSCELSDFDLAEPPTEPSPTDPGTGVPVEGFVFVTG